LKAHWRNKCGGKKPAKKRDFILKFGALDIIDYFFISGKVGVY